MPTIPRCARNDTLASPPSSTERDHCGRQPYHEQHDRREEAPLEREPLVISELHASEADEQIRGRHERTQKVNRLPDDGGPPDLRGADAVHRRRLAENR